MLLYNQLIMNHSWRTEPGSHEIRQLPEECSDLSCTNQRIAFPNVTQTTVAADSRCKNYFWASLSERPVPYQKNSTDLLILDDSRLDLLPLMKILTERIAKRAIEDGDGGRMEILDPVEQEETSWCERDQAQQTHDTKEHILMRFPLEPTRVDFFIYCYDGWEKRETQQKPVDETKDGCKVVNHGK